MLRPFQHGYLAIAALLSVVLPPTAGAAEPVFVDASPNLDGGLQIYSFPDGAGYSGVGVLDYDLDGDLDLYFGNGPNRPNALLENDGTGLFVDVAEQRGAALGTGSRSVLAADIDNDGYTDLVLPGDRSNLRLLRNIGGDFVDRTEFTGLFGARRNNSAHAADVNGDGLLDVYIGASLVPSENYINTLWVNQGDGKYVNQAAAAGVDTSWGVCASTFTHFDDGDDIDLVVVNCSSVGIGAMPIEMYQGHGDGTFTDIADSAGVWNLGFWMAVAIGDYNGDGAMDFFSTNHGPNPNGEPHVLYENNNDGTWSEVAAEAGLAEYEFGWGAVAADFDNDGWVDLYYTGWPHVSPEPGSPGYLFMNRGDGTFHEPTVPVDMYGLWSLGVAVGDFDGNGFTDIVVVVGDNPQDPQNPDSVLMLNQGNANHWLTVRPRGVTVNRQAIGARIRAVSGDHHQVREVNAGSSYMSTNTPWPSFGLGSETTVEICVRWPDGTGEDFGVFDADQIVDLVQGQGIGEVPCQRPMADDPEAENKKVDEGRKCGCAAAPPGPIPVLPLLMLVAVATGRRRE